MAEETEGTAQFNASGAAYDAFMGRYSRPLAAGFAAAAGVQPGQRCLDVGCGAGALTEELIKRLGAAGVAACDPSAPFVAECRARHPDVDVRPGRAEDLPFPDREFDGALAQLVLHFASDPAAAAAEMARVTLPGGVVAACVWEFGRGMEMLRLFWEAALSLDPQAPDELRTMRFGTPGELSQWLADAGLTDIDEGMLSSSSTYADFDELWAGFRLGVGPAGAYCVSLPEPHQTALRAELYARVGAPTGSFTLQAGALYATGRVNPTD